jgi:hypothetical protein
MIERGRTLSQADSAGTRERITPVWNDAFFWNQKIYDRAIYKPLLSVGFPASNVIRNYKGLQANAIMDDYENIFIIPELASQFYQSVRIFPTFNQS